MPKVNIYQPATGGFDVETGRPIEPVQDRRVSVGWSKGQYAQIGVGWVDPTKSVKDLRESTTSSSSAPPVFGEADEQARVWLSQWMDLDRQTINQLIRELRTARDAAFGRDE